MKEKELIALFESCNSKFIDWVGECHDCKKDIKVTAEKTETIIDDKVKIDVNTLPLIEAGASKLLRQSNSLSQELRYL